VETLIQAMRLARKAIRIGGGGGAGAARLRAEKRSASEDAEVLA
jgi:hypothetical protein